jgi:hypothetical protein
MPSTQNIVKIEAIRDGVVLLKGGAMRGVLHVSSINFALKSQEEQEAIIYSFQGFLNSLDFDVQIFINSRFLNVDDYILALQELENKQQNDLLRIQTQEYRKFVKEFVEGANIISTDFFIIIPFTVHDSTAPVQDGGGMLSFLGLGEAGKPAQMEKERFAHYRSQLIQRMDFVASNMHRMGLLTKPLNTEELIILFWNLYNPQGLKKRALIKPLIEKY